MTSSAENSRFITEKVCSGNEAPPSMDGSAGDVTEEQPFVTEKKEPLSGYERNLYLYHDEMENRPRVATLLNSLANYSATISSAPTDNDAGGGAAGDEGGGTKGKPEAKLGTLAGVYFPCMQNIFGVILFIRLTWVIGTAGVIQSFFIVFMCCCCTMLTAISMSAIATNGVVPAGGPYFMISRNLGPEFGGAIGLLFYVGTTFAASMYIVGGIEILITYMAPSLMLFGDPRIDPEVLYNNLRLYGTGLLAIMGLVVYVGVKPVSKAAPIVLLCVILSILAVYAGIAMNWNGSDKLWMCLLGNRLLSEEHTGNCTKEEGSPLWNLFCEYRETVVRNQTVMMPFCDPYFEANNVSLTSGIKGLASGVFFENLGAKYLEEGQYVSRTSNPVDVEALDRPQYNHVVSDISSAFTVLVGIFFPSVTGIMAGCNRSGDLADAQRSIPIGTIMAILTTSTVYISAVFLFAASFDGLLMRDKFGTSIGGRLVVANLAWPNEWTILIGSFMATTGAGLQSLISGPRLLQAVAKDNLVPALAPFGTTSARGEPVNALLLSLALCEFGVLLGNVDVLAPLLSMFFLMLYGFVNLACALQTLLRTPNWRPRFRYYHWSLSFLGASLCVAIMFMSSWYYALIAMGLASLLYKYIEYRGAEKEWGDGLSGLALSAARYSLLRLEEGPPHTKNWRPQLLLLVKLSPDLVPVERHIFSLTSQLKAGKGLTVAVSVLPGEFTEQASQAQAAKQSLRKVMEEEKVKGFVDVLVAKDVAEGLSNLIQSTGLGGLKPNTVVMGWPQGWRRKQANDADNNSSAAGAEAAESGGEAVNDPQLLNSWRRFMDVVRAVAANKMALLVPKGLHRFPEAQEKLSGHIDVWWVVHDGGMLMLLPFLLKQNRVWKNCRLRIFTVAQMEDNSIQMKKDLKSFLYNLRIDAEVEVVEMMDSDISAYTYERTLVMEQRNDILRQMRSSKRPSLSTVQSIMDQAVEQRGSRVRFSEEKRLPTAAEDQELQEVCTDTAGKPSRTTSPTSPTILSPHKEEKTRPLVVPTLSVDAPAPEADSFNSEADTGSPTSVPTAPRTTANLLTVTPDETNVRRMHTAVKLNEVIVERSHNAELVVLNLPPPPKHGPLHNEANYMEFLEVLTEGLERVLMVRGSGREVITIYS